MLSAAILRAPASSAELIGAVGFAAFSEHLFVFHG